MMRNRRLGLSSLLLVVGVVACTSSSFDTASTDEDGGPRSDTAAGDGATIDSAGGGDTAIPPGDVGPPGDGSTACVSLSPAATDVYVDKRFGGAVSNGTETCPFTTITAAIALPATASGTRTIHVAGGAIPVVYNEPSSIVVPHATVLLGEGPTKTTINASGPCGTGTCAVMVSSDAKVDGFTVVSAGGDGIVTATGTPAPIVLDVRANGSKLNGIEVLGAIELGPNVSANRNTRDGLHSSGFGVVHVIAGANEFDNNTLSGIEIDGNATLQIDGASASFNSLNGVRLSWSAPAPGTGPQHLIVGLVATSNKNAGIAAFSGQNLKIRSSKLLTNSYGLNYQYAGTGALDLGTSVAPGGNTFGVTTVATRNTMAGIFLCRSRGTASQSAEGNGWSKCAPSQNPTGGCDILPAAYVDIAYAGAIAGDPVALSSCTSGP
ncbi:MAG: right-handed parallel beta-helix repeat-containing protein [Polyangiales bacterium]